VFEILSRGEVPYRQLASNGDVMSFVASGGRLLLPSDAAHDFACAEELFALANRCWAEDPTERPKFNGGIVKGLTAMMRAQEAAKADVPADGRTVESVVVAAIRGEPSPAPLGASGEYFSSSAEPDSDPGNTYSRTPVEGGTPVDVEDNIYVEDDASDEDDIYSSFG
jgi:Protein tyrosine and serine/threonine kinase